MKQHKCKFCGAIDSHWSFQCHTQRKPIKVNIVTKEWKAKNDAIKASKPRTKIKPKSDKQKKIDAAYSVLRPQFLKARPYCEARLEGCTTMAVSVHHQYMGSNKRKHYLNTLTWTPICQNCHMVCHNKLSKEEQIEKGLRILD